ncbi:hypothetical protein [Cohnella sp.]|uniref:hypothetical protein n=1 Tax=Cohnella sp. TaxID=1883426 RepID=UPI003561753A
MKKIHCLFVILFLSILIACGNETIEKKETLINPTKEESTSEEIEPDITLQNSKVKDISSLIPDGWGILKAFDEELVKAEGDLNKDAINDIAIVIEEIKESEEAPSRALLIAFRNKEGTLSLSIIAKKVILEKDEGGVWGDPFESLSIDRGSVLVSDYGGSNWRWYNRYRFRFQDNDWYLIGATMGSYFTGNATMDNADEEDYNLLTGDYLIKRTDEEGYVKITKGNRGKKQLVKLSEFNIEDM